MDTETTTGPDAPAAASSPAPVDGSTYLASLTREQRQEWNRTGTLPDATTPADSSSAQPGDQAASTDASRAAASEPANPADKQKAPRPDVKARNAQLDGEIAELKEKLRLRATLREELARTDRPTPDARTSDSSPERPKTTREEWQRYRAMPDAPQPDKFEHYEDFTAAMSVFIADKRFEEREQASRVDASQRAHVERVQRTVADANKRIEEHCQADPAFRDKVHPDLLEIVPAGLLALQPNAAIGPHNVVAQEILESKVMPQLFEYFSTPDGIQEWASLMALPPTKLLLGFGRIEARFLPAAGTAAAGEKKPAAKTVTTAPEPPTTLGKKATDPVDQAESAVKNGDFRAYKRLADREDLNARR
ncbi:MAG TPA: hypothetical protein VEC57_15125 [Candidatus Limnocylindrales bacterium]|nr:hypothetical protein [Candidatus Limnocylindrales bacterium]